MTTLHHDARGAMDPTTSNGRGFLEVRNLKVHFPARRGLLADRQTGPVRAVDGVSFTVRRGETLGLVGESGCGKSTTGRAIVRLVSPTAGSIRLDGIELGALRGRRLRRMRSRMQMIFQDPYASLNPRLTVQRLVREPLDVHDVATDRERSARVRELLEVVGLDPTVASRYPHEFSGGQRQRIGIARALAVQPDLIVADEPVSALDVSVRAQVVNLLEELQRSFQLTYLFIAHDLSVVRHISDRVAVMYLGQVVELGDREDLYESPLHPYTQALLSAVPVPDPEVELRRNRIVLSGEMPNASAPPTGCRFRTRCWKAREICKEVAPEPVVHDRGHVAACHFPG